VELVVALVVRRRGWERVGGPRLRGEDKTLKEKSKYAGIVHRMASGGPYDAEGGSLHGYLRPGAIQSGNHGPPPGIKIRSQRPASDYKARGLSRNEEAIKAECLASAEDQGCAPPCQLGSGLARRRKTFIGWNGWFLPNEDHGKVEAASVRTL
jgi:hypothetical protein